MSKTKIVVFSLIPLTIVLLILEIVGRMIYPFDLAGRARMIADRDTRREIAPFVNADPRVILEDIYGIKRRYVSFLGFIGAPNIELTTLRTNFLGFRDSDIKPRSSDEYRILVLGGSAAWSWGASSNENTITGALERLLNDTGSKHKYRVMNASFFAWTSRQELIALMEFYDRFDPDLVIAFTGFNDIISILHGSIRDQIQIRREFRMLEKAVEDNLLPMDTLTAVRKVVGSLGIWRIVVYIKEQRSSRKGRPRQYDPERAKYGIPKILDRYLTMGQYVSRHGAQFLLAMQPEIYSTKKFFTTDEAKLKEWIDSKHGDNFGNTFSQYRAELLKGLTALNKLDVRVVDLGVAFDGIEEAVFVDDSHFNDNGYIALADVLRGMIIEELKGQDSN